MRRLLRRKQISATLLSVMAGAFLAAPKANALVESFSFTTQCYGVICTAAWSKVSGYVDSIINRGALVTGYAFGPGYFSQSQLVQVGWFPGNPGPHIAEVYGFGQCDCVLPGVHQAIGEHGYHVFIMAPGLEGNEWQYSSTSYSFTIPGGWVPSC
jgi:hypothetical protein